jgi:hypothetical protein
MFAHLAHRFLDAADAFFAASRVAGAVDRGTRPFPHDLDRLGIARHAFDHLR